MFDFWPVYSGERFRASWPSCLKLDPCPSRTNFQRFQLFKCPNFFTRFDRKNNIPVSVPVKFLLLLSIVGQGPMSLAVGAGGGYLDIFLSSIFSFSLSGRRPDTD